MKYTMDHTRDGFGFRVRTARTHAEWKYVHRMASEKFERLYDDETEAIKTGTPPSDAFDQWEVIVTLTHEIRSLQNAIATLARDTGLKPND